MACQPEPPPPDFRVSLIADGRERTFEFNESVTVDQFLREIEVERGPNDRISPQPFTQITDGMRVTLVRVTEETVCENEEIPFQRNLVPNEGIPTGEERLARAGENGIQEICYRVIYEDGQQRDRVRTGQPTVLIEPIDEVVYIGLDTNVEPIPITGTLAYINNGNAWVVKGISTSKRPLTTESSLDSLVFDLSDNGQYLLYTSAPEDDETFLNQLYLIPTSENPESILLAPTDVLYAEWIPTQDDTISYSTGEARQTTPPWLALNNLWRMELDLDTGRTIDIDQLVDESAGGIYGWWGTHYQWSPDGQQVAWTRADSLGLVNLDTGDLDPLVNYEVFSTGQQWSWRANISWSPDGQRIATTVHGPPIGNEPPQSSAVFNVAVTNTEGSFVGTVQETTGIWTTPKFSPPLTNTNSEFPQSYIAYLQARDPFNSISGEYDLVVADRDGSNRRVIFPDP